LTIDIFGPNDGIFYEASRVGETGEERLGAFVVWLCGLFLVHNCSNVWK